MDRGLTTTNKAEFGPAFLRTRKSIELLRRAVGCRGPALIWDSPEAQWWPTIPRIVVGREAGPAAWQTDQSLSRKHFEVKGNQLRDLGSANQTFVNNRPYGELQLIHGDVVMAGGQLFVFCDEFEAAEHCNQSPTQDHSLHDGGTSDANGPADNPAT